VEIIKVIICRRIYSVSGVRMLADHTGSVFIETGVSG